MGTSGFPSTCGHLVTKTEVDKFISDTLKTQLCKDTLNGIVSWDKSCSVDVPAGSGKIQTFVMKSTGTFTSLINDKAILSCGMAFTYTSGLLEYLENHSRCDPLLVAAPNYNEWALRFCELLTRAPLHLFGKDTLNKIKQLLEVLPRTYKDKELKITKIRSYQVNKQITGGKCLVQTTLAPD